MVCSGAASSLLVSRIGTDAVTVSDGTICADNTGLLP